MNKWIGIGRLTGDPEVKYTQGDAPMAIARHNLAVDRKFKNKDGEQTADFISCVAFGKNAEFAEKYLRKGMKVAVEGHIQTGSYTNKDGVKVYTTDIVVEGYEFCESKGNSEGGYSTSTGRPSPSNAPSSDGFMNIPDDIQEELPFN